MYKTTVPIARVTKRDATDGSRVMTWNAQFRYVLVQQSPLSCGAHEEWARTQVRHVVLDNYETPLEFKRE